MYSKKSLSKKLIASVAAFAVAATTLAQPGIFSKKQTVQAAGSDNYAKLLQESLFMYDANMCGSKAGSTSLFTWRDACHTNDEVDGGYHDAGDHVMFGLPQGYTASTIGWAYYEFKDSFDSLGITDHFKTVSDYFCKFFKDATQLNGNSVSKFCWQKGDGNQDHAYWGAPESQGNRGGCEWASSGHGDIAAEYAAALAASYINFGNAEDLTYAKALFNYAKQNASPTVAGEFYASDSVADDIAWAAAWLYKATKDSSYQSDFINKPVYWVHCWNSVELGAAILAAEENGQWGNANNYLASNCNGNGYFFADKWGSARHNATMQMCALVADKNGGGSYASWAKGQMDYLLGNNPSGKCFVVGFADNSSKYPHHRAASGLSSASNGNNGYVHTLTGALVGGPTDAGGSYNDDIGDYVANEVAIDYNAGLVGAAAGLYAKYKTGTVADSIPETKNNGVGSGKTNPGSSTTTEAPTTTAPNKDTKASTTTTTKKDSSSSSSSDEGYTVKYNKSIDYNKLPENDKMIGFDWADFKIPTSEVKNIKKIKVNISASSSIGKWQGAFGTSTSVDPDYWAQSEDMEQKISGNSGSIEWEIPSSVASVIQTQYEGQLKFGVWWIDCGQFTIDSISVITSGNGSGTKVTTASGKTDSGSSSGGYTVKTNKSIDYNKLPENDKMIGFDWADFKIPTSEVKNIKKIAVNISSSSSIGKWQGAFGTSTSVDPDYWAQSEDMEQKISGNSGSIEWDVPSSVAKVIQTQYEGQLKFGVWWIDCGEFTIDSITVYTTGGSTSVTEAPVTTTKKVTTTTKVTTTEPKVTTTKATTKATTTTAKEPDELKGDANGDGVVNAADLSLLVNSMLGKSTLSFEEQDALDMNRDGKISVIDLVKLKNILA